MRDKFLPFSPPLIGEEEINEVIDTLRSDWITTGPKVKRFEQDFAQFVQAPDALAVSSGTAALHLSLLALGIGAGDAVMVKGSLGSRMGPIVKALEHRYDRHLAGEPASAQG